MLRPGKSAWQSVRSRAGNALIQPLPTLPLFPKFALWSVQRRIGWIGARSGSVVNSGERLYDSGFSWDFYSVMASSQYLYVRVVRPRSRNSFHFTICFSVRLIRFAIGFLPCSHFLSSIGFVVVGSGSFADTSRLWSTALTCFKRILVPRSKGARCLIKQRRQSVVSSIRTKRGLSPFSPCKRLAFVSSWAWDYAFDLCRLHLLPKGVLRSRVVREFLYYVVCCGRCVSAGFLVVVPCSFADLNSSPCCQRVIQIVCTWSGKVLARYGRIISSAECNATK
eukprot:TRINITY_DN4152_c0_g1_i5.p1 TRINITY_DN4152_c0_g1~~TRINITY_DN4152_c0_g1_i5.p1  ORF type:complete len:280 (-),score=-79.11 TRINITY_DN4152_c0_g1_i5:519-1358(-)